MKNLLYIIMFFAVLITSCDPLDDTYEELDKMTSDPSAEQVFEFTLSDDDYDLIAEQLDSVTYFNSEDDAKDYIPIVLANNYPQLGDGSSITVTYNLDRGGSETVSPYTNAGSYTISDEDYNNVASEVGSAGFFNSTFMAEDYIPGILGNKIQDPVDGQIEAVSYKYADTEYADISGEVVYDETFDAEAGLDTYDKQSVEGAQEWTWDEFSSDGYAKMSGYAGGAVANEDWLVTPEIDLTSSSNVKLKFTQAINFLGAGVTGEDIAVKISKDYDDDVTSATWEDLELNVWPTGDNWTFVNSEVDLTEYEGDQVYIAFYYTSTVDDAATWEVSNVTIEAGETIATTGINVFYEYSADESMWVPVNQSEVYYLSSADYDAMGAPGQYDNFSSSVPADNYIPQLLMRKFPYAQEEDQEIVVYKYYSSSANNGNGATQTRGNVYTYMNGQWMPYANEIEATLQFGNEDGIWVPDNTIRYTFITDDYTEAGKEENALGNAAARTNLRNFGNFGTQWSHDELVGVIDFILKLRFPSSEVGQKYLVTYNTYPGGDIETHVELMDSGNYEEIE